MKKARNIILDVVGIALIIGIFATVNVIDDVFTNYTMNSDELIASSSNVAVATKNIFIGDSRTVGLCISFATDWESCSYSVGGAYINGDDIYIAECSESYTWFVETAIPAVNEILEANPGVKFNIISNMGINMLLYDLDNYIAKYTELSYNDWSDQNIIIVSVNPVDEEAQANNMYFVASSDIEYFNKTMQDSLSGLENITFCDVYNRILYNFKADDGIHYDTETYHLIYNEILSCLNS